MMTINPLGCIIVGVVSVVAIYEDTKKNEQ